MRITRITRQLLAATLLIGMGGMATPAQAESTQRACRNLAAQSPDRAAYAAYRRCGNGDSILYTGRIYDLKADGLSAQIFGGGRLRAAATTTSNGRSFTIQSFSPALDICTGNGGNPGRCNIMR